MTAANTGSFGGMIAIGVLILALPVSVQDFAQSTRNESAPPPEMSEEGVAKPESPGDHAEEQPSETASSGKDGADGPKPVDMAFMYKGIGKFVTPEDQDQVKDLLKAAETLGPDGARLILEEIDRRVPNGRGFDFDGIMWCNEDNEFAAIDVYARPGMVPEDWPGLMGPPFNFPIKASYLVGRTQDWAWFGSVSMGVRVCERGHETQLVASYAELYQKIADLVRGPEWILDRFRRTHGQNHGTTMKDVEGGPDNGESLRLIKWRSADGDFTAVLVGDWPFALEENPQGECLLIRHWPNARGPSAKMWVGRLWISLLEPGGYTLSVLSPKDLFGVYAFYGALKRYGLFHVSDKTEFKDNHLSKHIAFPQEGPRSNP